MLAARSTATDRSPALPTSRRSSDGGSHRRITTETGASPDSRTADTTVTPRSRSTSPSRSSACMSGSPAGHEGTSTNTSSRGIISAPPGGSCPSSARKRLTACEHRVRSRISSCGLDSIVPCRGRWRSLGDAKDGLIAVLAIVVFAAGWLAGTGNRLGGRPGISDGGRTSVRGPDAERQHGRDVHRVGREERTPRTDRYEIASVEKVGEDLLALNAKMDCCGLNGATVPIAVPMRWVGDTPVIMMTNTGLPGIGPTASACSSTAITTRGLAGERGGGSHRPAGEAAAGEPQLVGAGSPGAKTPRYRTGRLDPRYQAVPRRAGSPPPPLTNAPVRAPAAEERPSPADIAPTCPPTRPQAVDCAASSKSE